MVRAVLLAALIAGLLAVAGCGAAAPSAGGLAPAASPPAAAPIETTDGRLGDATAVEPGASRALSEGGAFDLAERRDAPRRDGVGAGAACADVDLAPSAETLPAVAAATLCLLNGERTDHGLAPLAADDRLGGAASAYAADLVAGSYFSHTGRDGSGVLDRIRRTGYLRDDRPWRIGENLAWGTGALASPAAIVQAWMNSPGHRDNILNGAYREIGVGVVVGNPARTDGAGATYATEFGVIEDGAAAAAVPKKPKKRSGARKARPSRGGKQARVARRGGKGRGKGSRSRRVKGRGPVAHIAI